MHAQMELFVCDVVDIVCDMCVTWYHCVYHCWVQRLGRFLSFMTVTVPYDCETILPFLDLPPSSGWGVIFGSFPHLMWSKSYGTFSWMLNPHWHNLYVQQISQKLSKINTQFDHNVRVLQIPEEKQHSQFPRQKQPARRHTNTLKKEPRPGSFHFFNKALYPSLRSRRVPLLNEKFSKKSLVACLFLSLVPVHLWQLFWMEFCFDFGFSSSLCWGGLCSARIRPLICLPIAYFCSVRWNQPMGSQELKADHQHPGDKTLKLYFGVFPWMLFFSSSPKNPVYDVQLFDIFSLSVITDSGTINKRQVWFFFLCYILLSSEKTQVLTDYPKVYFLFQISWNQFVKLHRNPFM